MFPKTLLLLLLLSLLPGLSFGQNATMPLEDTRESKILDLQNQLFKLQKISDSLKEQGESLSTTMEEIRQATSTHGQDILKAMDAINTISTTSLETGETVAQEVETIKKAQAAYAKQYETILIELSEQKKELLTAIDMVDRKRDDILATKNTLLMKKDESLETTIRELEKTITGQAKTIANQDGLIIKMQKKISLLENALTGERKAVQEIKDLITSQKAKTLGHLSSLENINATLSGLKQQSRTELQNIHQSLTQVVTYGLLTIIGVTLFLLLLFLLMRRKPAQPAKDREKESPPQAAVREEDDEILDWLKQKGQPEK